jgi:hypothetical protein
MSLFAGFRSTNELWLAHGCASRRGVEVALLIFRTAIAACFRLVGLLARQKSLC